MSEQNPYQAPTAKVEVPLETGQLGEPRGVPAGRGFSWFGEGFDLFKRNPWIWILNVIIFFVILMLLGLIPIISLGSATGTPCTHSPSSTAMRATAPSGTWCQNTNQSMMPA